MIIKRILQAKNENGHFLQKCQNVFILRHDLKRARLFQAEVSTLVWRRRQDRKTAQQRSQFSAVLYYNHSRYDSSRLTGSDFELKFCIETLVSGDYKITGSTSDTNRKLISCSICDFKECLENRKYFRLKSFLNSKYHTKYNINLSGNFTSIDRPEVHFL